MYLPIFLCLFSSCFCWELRRKTEPKAKDHKIRKFIQTGNLEKLPKINRLPQLSKAKSLHVPEKSPFDPCTSSNSVCLNGGTCLNKDGSFLCQCPPTYYGKKCEILADTKKCSGHRCQHGATCVSLPSSIQIIDPELEANYTKKKKDNEPLPLTELKKMIINVTYECICTPGFVGLLCEMSEIELECQEDYCMGRGTAIYTDGTCTCDCHENYLGTRCETENPCRHYECYNSGVCRPIVDIEKGTVEAVCDCPKIQMIDAVISGEQCETVQVSDADWNTPLVPCKEGDSLSKWFAEAANWMAYSPEIPGSMEVSYALKEIINSCMDNKGNYCNGTIMRRITGCFHSGECQERVVTFANDISILMPFCKCKGADAGRFCEFQRDDECDPTPEEMAAGVTRASRCTDEHHGNCVMVLGEPKCHCRAGYVGEMCEIYDPCSDNPCWNSECIPIPSETIVEIGGQQKQTYRCLCSMGDEMSGPNKCIFSATGNCSNPNLCHEGQCVTCDHSEEEEMLQLCTEQQQKDGFRCICKPGFELPYCEKLADPCANNLCENRAICQPTTKYNYDCQCLPGTRGTLCEEIVDICVAFGEVHCIHGTCYKDLSSLRGFSCDCDYGYYGRNCQFLMGTAELWKMILWDEYYWITLPVLAASVVMIFMGIVYFWCERIEPKKNRKNKSVEESRQSKKNMASDNEKETSTMERKVGWLFV